MNDAECMFNFILSNSIQHTEDGEICISVKSREHNMNIARIVNVGKETRIKLMKSFDELYIALETEIKLHKESPYD